MASAEFLEQALSTDVDENDVNAIVGNLETHLVTSVPSISSQNYLLNAIPNQISSTSSENTNYGQKYNKDLSDGGITDTNYHSSATSVSLSISASQNSILNGEQVIDPQSQTFSFLHAVQGNNVAQSGIKINNIQPPLVINGTTSGQVGMQPGLVSMNVNSSMSGSIPNVMLNKAGGQNVVVTTQNLGAAQPAMLPNVQILNMRPGAPPVAAQKSVATVSPRVVIGTPQVVGTRAAAPGITLQTLQSLQQGQQGHLLLKTENGQYQLLRVGPAPGSGLAGPQQTLRLSTVPAHPGVPTVSTSMAAPGHMPPGPVATPVPAASIASVSGPTVPSAPPAPAHAPSIPIVTTQKPLDNTKEKCRNFLANLLDLSSKEPQTVEISVRNLIQELIDAQVEPEEFCDRLERLLNASPQPCLIGFLKKSLPLLRQSLVTNELVIEGINPPSPHVAFLPLPLPGPQAVAATNNIQLSDDEGSSSPTLTTLLPPVLPPLLSPPSPMPVPLTAQSIITQLEDDGSSSPILTTLLPPSLLAFSGSSSAVAPFTSTLVPHLRESAMVDREQILTEQKPPSKPGSTIAVLQNIPVHTKINVNKVGKTMPVSGKNFSRTAAPSAALSTVLTAGKSLLKEKKGGMQYSQPFPDDKMAGDDDINDVAAMGGVNLAEETQRILGSTDMIGTQIRSCKDEYLVPMAVMQARVKAVSAKHGLGEPPPEVAVLMNLALQERLKNLIEKLAVIAQHRIDMNVKSDNRYEITQDVKGQLKFLEELDKVDKKRREDSEREILLRAAKSRSKSEDPEQVKLKAKAKEMQRAELEEMRTREANLTALQAIGPRKKPRLDAPGTSGDSALSANQGPGSSGSRGQVGLLRTRLKRITLRDMICLLEQEKETSRSSLLYRSYLK